jgi:L-seryl-tRNA(Ser) seleniumtransferase
MRQKGLAGIPSVDKLVNELGDCGMPRAVVVAVIRRELATARAQRALPDAAAIVERVRCAVADLRAARIRPVINGTGIIIHTNLGRAPLGEKVAAALHSVATSYNNLEFDLTGGRRGGRAAYLEHNLALLCGAQGATVVNNNAAALLLILRQLVSEQKPQVVISRGELIQIGGGFRIPEILQASGATLREVGTTNKTTLNDYSRAIGKQTAMLLKVHRSNFYMDGFVESPATEDLSALAKKKRVPLVEDLGSGATVRTETIADIEHEPTPAEVLKCGVDLVCFSGDKLLGGPQAGIIAGKEKFIARLKRQPMFRALRCDKLILAALQETVDLHLRAAEPADGRANHPVPVIEMMRVSCDVLRARAQAIARGLADLPLTISVGQGKSQIGGGTLPRSSIASVTLDLLPRDMSLEELASRLRSAEPPVIGYISGGRLKLDLRTIFPRQDPEVREALRKALIAGSPIKRSMGASPMFS